MEYWKYFILIIGLLSIFCGYKIINTIKKYIHNKLEKDYQDKIKVLEQNYKQQQKELSQQLEDEYNRERILYEAFTKELEEKKRLNETIVINNKEKIDQQLKQYEAHQHELINIKFQAKEQELQKRYEEMSQHLDDNYESQKQEILTNLKEITDKLKAEQDKYTAYINQLKIDEQKHERIKFCTIQLTEKDKSDINLLSSIEEQLYNKEAINRLIYDLYIKKPLNDMMIRVIGVNSYGGIYKITNINSGKSYIGQSTDIKQRWTNHIKATLGFSSIAHQEIHDVIHREGIDQFTFEIIEKLPKEKLNEREKYWINFYQTQEWGYNKKRGG